MSLSSILYSEGLSLAKTCTLLVALISLCLLQQVATIGVPGKFEFKFNEVIVTKKFKYE